MMTIARSPHNRFYTVLLIDDASFDDIKERLEENGTLWKYLVNEEGDSVIVFGATALKRQSTEF